MGSRTGQIEGVLRPRRGAPGVAWLAVAGALLLALAPPARAQRHPVRNYSVGDGLPNSAIIDVEQGRDGLIWVSTRSGIASSVGADWRRWGPEDGLPHPDPGLLDVDHERRPWVVTILAPPRISYLEGERWLFFSSSRPLVWSPRKRSLITAFRVLRWQGEPLMAIGFADGQLAICAADSWSLHQLARGSIRREVGPVAILGDRLLAVTPAGLTAVSIGERKEVDPGLFDRPSEGVLAVHREPEQGPLWIVERDWISHLAPGGSRCGWPLPFTARSADWPWVAEHDGAGGLLFGNAKDLFRFDPDTGLERLGRGSGLASDGVQALLSDSEGNIWSGASHGLSKLVSRGFTSLRAEHGLLADEVSAVLELRSGQIVLGHEGGLTVLDPSSLEVVRRCVPLESLDSFARVLDLAEDAEGNIWAAMAWGGLLRLAPDGSHRHYGEGEGFSTLVSSLLIDRGGTLRVGGGFGVWRQLDGGWGPDPDFSTGGKKPYYARSLVEGADGAIYVAVGRAGVLRVGKDGLDHWRHPDDIRANDVFAIHELPDGTAWAGTRSGVYRVGEGIYEKVAPPGPATDRSVFFIVEDAASRLWLGTDDGVLLWDGDRMRSFSVQDGLIGCETNRAAGIVDSRGRVWIGTDEGVSIYREDPGAPRPRPPLIRLLDLRASDGSLSSLQAPVEVASRANTIDLGFRAISFVDEDRVRFETWLEGFESARCSPRSLPTHSVRFTNLPAGVYYFHLRALSAEGVWSEETISAPIRVLGPLWARPWFIALASLLAASAAFAAFSYASQRRYSNRLAGDVAKRTRELAAARQAAESEKRRFGAILASVADGVVATDDAGRVLLLNQAGQRITGWTAGEACARPLARVLQLQDGAVLPGESREEGPALAAEADGEPAVARFRHKDGELRWLEMSPARIAGSEGLAGGIVLAFRDVTLRRRMEAELIRTQKLESLGLLAGGIAHDFNNLMMVMTGALAIIEEGGGIEESGRRMIDSAEEAARRARHLTGQLLTFSKGGGPVAKLVALAPLIADTATIAMSGRNVQCHLELAEDFGAAEVDPGQISQVISNLLINAAQAMPEGGAIRLRARRGRGEEVRLDAGWAAILEVIDEGPGIPEELCSRIFNPYFTTKETGTGIGLTIADSIARSHQGRIEVDSAPGLGATFRLVIPASSLRAPDDPAPPLPARTDELRALVMDDKEAIRRVFSQMLEQLGHQVQLTSSGEEAIRTWHQARKDGRPFDLVFLDLTVPGGMGGKETVARLRILDPGVRAVAASGYSNDPVLARHTEFGFASAIGKPFGLRDLEAVIHAALGPAEPELQGRH